MCQEPRTLSKEECIQRRPERLPLPGPEAAEDGETALLGRAPPGRGLTGSGPWWGAGTWPCPLDGQEAAEPTDGPPWHPSLRVLSPLEDEVARSHGREDQ